MNFDGCYNGTKMENCKLYLLCTGERKLYIRINDELCWNPVQPNWFKIGIIIPRLVIDKISIISFEVNLTEDEKSFNDGDYIEQKLYVLPKNIDALSEIEIIEEILKKLVRLKPICITGNGINASVFFCEPENSIVYYEWEVSGNKKIVHRYKKLNDCINGDTNIVLSASNYKNEADFVLESVAFRNSFQVFD
jgi:hypothetical protein